LSAARRRYELDGRREFHTRMHRVAPSNFTHCNPRAVGLGVQTTAEGHVLIYERLRQPPLAGAIRQTLPTVTGSKIAPRLAIRHPSEETLFLNNPLST